MGTVGVREITAADILVREWPQIHQARFVHERVSLFSKSARQPLGPTQPPTPWVPWLFQGIKQLWRDVDY